MIYHGNNEELHPAHRGFAESINADILSISETSPHSIQSFCQELYRGYSIGEYDTIIAEGSRPLYAGLVHKMRYGSNLVYLCADHRLYELWNNSIEVESRYEFFKYILGSYGKPIVRTIAQAGIDGVIAVSDFVKEYLYPIFGDTIPIRIAHPYIQSDLYDQLRNITPNPDLKTAITIGRATRYKGVDLLVDSWPIVRKQYPNAELQIVGQGHPESYEDTDGVTVRGFVEDIAEVYSNAGLYIQPSRIDPFPVTVLESLQAGVPAVVTESTGSRSVIKDLDENLVSTADPDGLANKIQWYFGNSAEKKEELSRAAREKGEAFDEGTRKKLFEQTFHNLREDM